MSTPVNTAAPRRWCELSQDPNSKPALAHRTASVAKSATKTLIKDRIAYICDLATGKDVLDIGVVEHLAESSYAASWLHAHLHRHSRRCVGVDVLEEDVAHLCSRGYNVVCADLTATPLEETFDLIVCGEVFEHLPAPQFMLSNLAKMLRPEGQIVITVPNPWYINVIVKSVFGQRAYIDSADHICWFDPATIAELAERVGLQLAKHLGVAVSKPRTLKARLFFSVQPALIACGVNPRAFAKTIVYQLRKQ